MTAEVNKKIVSPRLARSGALKRGATATVCPSGNHQARTGQWSDGWVVFADRNTVGQVEATDETNAFTKRLTQT